MTSVSDRVTVGVVLALVTLAFTACGDGGGTTPDDEAADDSHSQRVAVPTGEWRPGDPGRRALLEGRLDMSDPACPRVVSGDEGEGTLVVWPAGTYAAEGSGAYGLYAEGGTPLASDGDQLVLSGGFDSGVDFGCEGAGGRAFVVEAEVRLAER